MQDDEYAIVSKKEFLALKKELERIKKNPLEGSDAGETLQGGIDNLNKSLNIMLEVFKQASEDMKLDEHDNTIVNKQMGPMNEKIDTLIDQNQKIAKGIVAIADMVKEKLEEMGHDAPVLASAPAPAPAPAPVQALPPLSGGPGPAPGMMPPGPGAPPGIPQGMPPPGASLPPPEGMEAPGTGLPPLTPPGAPQGMPPPGAPQGPGDKKTILGGLMK